MACGAPSQLRRLSITAGPCTNASLGKLSGANPCSQSSNLTVCRLRRSCAAVPGHHQTAAAGDGRL